MTRHFSAVVLLDSAWPIDIDAIAASVRARYGSIGHVDAIPGQSDTTVAGLIRIDGANVVVTATNARIDMHDLSPHLKVMRHWNPAEALARHTSSITISCGGGLPGLEGAEAYAAAVHFVAAAFVQIAPAVAVFWPKGYALTEPRAFLEAADTLLTGRIPVGAWISFAAVVPRGYDKKDALGMVTYGMRPFIGRELELAPRPGAARDAYKCLLSVARRLLDRGHDIADGHRLIGLDSSFDVTVRERNYWLRRDLSAYVLVADDAVVATETLRPREALSA